MFKITLKTFTLRAGMSTPRLFVSPDAQPNAFATGRNERSAVVCVTDAIVAPVAASVMQMALSRSREFEADRLGAELVGDPRPLASAMAKLDRAARAVPMDVAPAQATAYIVNPLTGRGVKFSNLFLTHPPTEARITALLARDLAVVSR